MEQTVSGVFNYILEGKGGADRPRKHIYTATDLVGLILGNGGEDKEEKLNKYSSTKNQNHNCLFKT